MAVTVNVHGVHNDKVRGMWLLSNCINCSYSKSPMMFTLNHGPQARQRPWHYFPPEFPNHHCTPVYEFGSVIKQ